MAWEQIIPRRKQRGVRIGLAKKGKGCARKVTISLAPEVREKVGLEVGHMVQVFRGTGGDEGLLKLCRSNRQGYQLISRSKGEAQHVSLQVPAWPGIDGSQSHIAQSVDWEVLEEGGQKVLVVNLPSWAGKVRFLDRGKAA